MTTYNPDTANDYLELCKNAEWALKNENKTLPNGYKIVKTLQKTGITGSRFKGVLYKKNNEYVIAFLGTDFSSPKEVMACAKMAAGSKPKQFKDAEMFVKDMMTKNDISPENLTYIGHSEGGSEALHCKAVIGAKEVYTYNGYVPNLDKYDRDRFENVYNIRTEGDIVSKAGESVGKDFIVPEKDDVKIPKGPLGAKGWHQINNMGDCRKAVPVEEYEKQNPKFKNKFRKGMLYSSEIAEIPQSLYPLFDEDIKDRMKNKAIIKGKRDFISNDSKCKGQYSVKAYTRSDGKKVAGYTRTCHVHG